MTYIGSFGKGEFTFFKKKSKSREIIGKWSAEWGNGFYRLSKHRTFSLYFDNGNNTYNKKADKLISRQQLNAEEYRQMRQSKAGSTFFEYASWELPIDECTSQYHCMGKQFIYYLSSDDFTVSGTIKDRLGHKLFDDYICSMC